MSLDLLYRYATAKCYVYIANLSVYEVTKYLPSGKSFFFGLQGSCHTILSLVRNI